MQSNLLALAVNLLLLVVLLPVWGLIGAVVAFLASRIADGAYLAIQLMRAYQAPLRALVEWKDLCKVSFAALSSAIVLYGSFWTDHFGLAGVAFGGVIYLGVFAVLLTILRVPEALLLFQHLRPKSILRRPS